MGLGYFLNSKKPYVIAEVGNNHIGDIEIAIKTIDAALAAGASAVKFQMFNPDELVSGNEPLLKHVPDKSISSQRERFRKMSLSKEEFLELAMYSKKIKIDFLCTPFDRESADFLEPLVPAFKIASGDANNFSLIDYVGKKKKPLFISTGLCTQDEVDILCDKIDKENTILFHCIASYPTADKDVNLSLIPYFKEKYNLSIGFSDHTIDTLASTLAVSLGAVAIEKHFILDKSIPGGDRDLSLTENSLRELISNMERSLKMVGDCPRKVLKSEEYGRVKLRRSVYAKKRIEKGSSIKLNDVKFMRPCEPNGIPMKNIYESNYLIAKEIIQEEELITETNVKVE